jgi:hypothetical protein
MLQNTLTAYKTQNIPAVSLVKTKIVSERCVPTSQKNNTYEFAIKI